MKEAHVGDNSVSAPVWESRVLPLSRRQLLTMNDRCHPMERARRTRQLRHWGYLLGREGRGVARLSLVRARVVFEVAYPDQRRRDRHNLAPTIKALVDGLIDAGLLPDDDDQHLDGPYTIVATRLAQRRLNVSMYEISAVVYVDCAEVADEAAGV